MGPSEGGIGADADKSTLELANVGLDSAGNEGHDLGRNVEPLGRNLALQDGEASLKIGGLNVGNQAPLEAGPEPLFESRDFLRRTIRGNHDLTSGVEGIEGVEELFLRPLLTLEELDVVDQEKTGRPITAVEGRDRSPLQSKNEIVHELFGGDIAHNHVWMTAGDVVTNRMEKVSFSETSSTVDEEGVVGISRGFGYGLRGRVS